MKLFTKTHEEKLLRNGQQSLEAIRKDGNTPDHMPVVKLFNPCGNQTWLITEIDPANPDIAFGLCDLAMGSPEIGSVSISELQAITGKFGLGIERDRWFVAGMTLAEYAKQARETGSIAA